MEDGCNEAAAKNQAAAAELAACRGKAGRAKVTDLSSSSSSLSLLVLLLHEKAE